MACSAVLKVSGHAQITSEESRGGEGKTTRHTAAEPRNDAREQSPGIRDCDPEEEPRGRAGVCALLGTTSGKGLAAGGLSVCLVSDRWKCGVLCTEQARMGTAWFQREARA